MLKDCLVSPTRPTIIACLGLMLFCWTQPCFAFESSEHERMSNLALHLAIGYYKENSGVEARLVDARHLVGKPGKYLTDDRGATSAALISYGDVVACVDFFLYPEKLLADSWKWNRSSVDATGFPVYVEGTKILEFATRCHSNAAPSGAQASHNNHAHFQQDLLFSFQLYHMAAVAKARGLDGSVGGNVFGALVLNALADHYLEDYFAPGHIVTPRERLSDVPATAMHDLGNERGINFKPLRMEELLPILGFMCRQDVSKLAMGNCSLRDGIYLEQIVSGSSPAALTTAVSNLASPHIRPIRLRGDLRLWDQNEQQLSQRVLMLLIQARSILDILEGHDSFIQAKWRSGTIGEFAPHAGPTWQDTPLNFAPAVAAITFGEYCLRESTCSDKQDEVISSTDEPRRAESPIKADSDSPSPYVYGTIYPVFGVSAHRESMSGGSRAGRFVYSAEMAGLGIPLSGSPNGRSPTVTLAPIFGYSYYHEGEISGGGPTLRVVANIPETEYTIGPYFRWLSYPSSEGRARRLSTGLRIDAGFSGYSTFFLGVGRDYAASPQGNLEHGWLWTAGVELAWPWSRTPLVRRPSQEPRSKPERVSPAAR